MEIGWTFLTYVCLFLRWCLGTSLFFKRFFGSSEQLARFYMNVFNAEDLYFGHVPNMHYRLALYLTSVLPIKHATANYSVCVCTIQTHCVEFVI